MHQEKSKHIMQKFQLNWGGILWQIIELENATITDSYPNSSWLIGNYSLYHYVVHGSRNMAFLTYFRIRRVE